MLRKISFSIIGGAGFRAQYYLRIARALPDLFHVAGMVVRDGEKGGEMERKWGVKTYRNMELLLTKEKPDFVVLSVSGSECAQSLFQLADAGIPVLTETPPGQNLDDLLALHERLTVNGAMVQVAEQYHLHPLNQARLALIDSGRLGEITQATVSVSHMYHGASLIRKMLGIQFEGAEIKAIRFTSPILAGPDRMGPPREEKILFTERDLAWIQFGEKLGIYDFTKDQHRSWIRSNHLSVRGVKGELFDSQVKLLSDFATPLPLELKRINRGEGENQEGYYLAGIIAGESWVYRNPFAPARLYDDEIAIAACLQKMAVYISGGPGFYGLPEASQDCYIGFKIEEAIATGETVKVSRQPWARFA